MRAVWFGLAALSFVVVVWVSSRPVKQRPYDPVHVGYRADLAAQSDEPGVTKAGYGRLTTGMTYAQVSALLGGSGEEQSSGDLGGVRTVQYQWRGGGSGALIVTFQNDRLVMKAQIGLQ